MSFLLLRLLPYIIPLWFFVATKLVFYYNDSWPWLFGLILAVSLLYFALLKYKNRDKPVILLVLFALIYEISGLAYSLVLENPVVINVYLLVWSLFYWLYLEAVFHDFYETAKTFIFNLSNITLYGNILIIFFLTAALTNFSIFLNLTFWQLLLILIVVYYCLLYLALLRQGRSMTQARLYGVINSLVLAELLGALIFLPLSFYVIAASLALGYYLLVSLSLLYLNNQLNRKILFSYLSFSILILAAILITATWI